MTNANPYANYSAERLAQTHAYWMSIYRASKNPEQRARAERGATWAAELMRAKRPA